MGSAPGTVLPPIGTKAGAKGAEAGRKMVGTQKHPWFAAPPTDHSI